MGTVSDRLEAGDLSYFLRSWQTYCKVRGLDYMFHSNVYDALHRALVADAAPGFSFVDVGCGDAAPSVEALRGTRVGSYIGIDLSRPALDLAEAEVARLDCAVRLIEIDYRLAIADWQEPVDVIWIGQSLHHVLSDDKPPVMRQLRRMLAPGGLFLIWEPTTLPGEDRFGWLERVDTCVHGWPGLDETEKATVIDHSRASDFPETEARWLELGQEAGFSAGKALLEAPPRLGTLYSFRG